MGRLLDRTDSVLIVVDAQSDFYGADRPTEPADAAAFAATLERCAWLAGVAAALGVPAIVTEEDPANNGPTDAAILAALPPGTPVFPKPVFGLADVPEILAAVEATGRRSAVLVGLETDVCVCHSALGLLDRGFKVAIVEDATYSPGAMAGHGLRRMVAAGAEVLHAKGVYYEWVRALDDVRAFERDYPSLRRPPGFAL